ncbi:hypothetical protein DSL64_00260 [Dyadobacter luteus]|jgi:hypothetical protein|uniref:Uncharacterized protein n=1 Tax=Dyadobacter luteus TaxID=2259619 RepID=A0A3D8YH70_9BACT|nr:hypothetical protein DSL64_00260 [Dyadobacter luteus]
MVRQRNKNSENYLLNKIKFVLIRIINTNRDAENTSCNILKNAVLSIIISVLFVKIQDVSNFISQIKGLIILFY